MIFEGEILYMKIMIMFYRYDRDIKKFVSNV